MFPGPLKVFHEVARAGSIRKASDAMGVAPSSVSRQVAILERQMGTRLLERSSGGIALTHAGRLVAAYARTVVMDFDSLKVDLDDMRGSRRRQIRLTMVESVVGDGPGAAIAAFRRQFDGVSFAMRILPAPVVVDTVKRDLCDLAITMSPAPDPAIRTLGIVAEPVVLAVAPDHPLAAREEVTLDELAAHPLAMPDESFGIRRIVDGSASAAGLVLDPVVTANTFGALRDCARHGIAAVLPRRAVRGAVAAGPLRAVPIAAEALSAGSLHIIALRERRLPRIVTLFADMLVGAVG